MQNDLISRRALIKTLRNRQPHLDLLASMIVSEVIEIIKEQPTAYDVEKVVEQLEKEFRKYYGYNWDKAPYLIKAIDIVRAGGKK